VAAVTRPDDTHATDGPDHPDDPDDPDEETLWAPPREGEEPEPDWASKIRSGRRDRGSRLREVYARFPDEETPLDEPAPRDDTEPRGGTPTEEPVK